MVVREQTVTADMRRIRRIHFVGIGGAGMSGIAEVLLNLGYEISGSDIQENGVTRRLQSLGVKVFIGHNEAQVVGADVVVLSTIIDEHNPEWQAARAKHLPIVRRAEMLAELMRFRYGIAIAGTHGKTTTTSLVASILHEAGLDPTYVIGGLLNSAGTNAHLGSGRYLVAEADESDASFLYLQPMLSIVTNIDADHLSNYQGRFENLQEAFLQFIQRLPFYGLAVMCLDDPIVKKLLPDVRRPVMTYGFDTEADVQISQFRAEGMRSYFRVMRGAPYAELDITLNLAGKHNALNATAAICIATELGVSDEAICGALVQFAGVGRRMQIHGTLPLEKSGTVHVMDDYGHHPREVEVTIAALKEAYPDRRLVMVFQPHRFSRTQECFSEFVRVLARVDQLLLLDVYPAGEAPIPGIHSAALCESIAQLSVGMPPIHLSQVEQLPHVLQEILEPDDILLFQGAGNVGALAPQVIATGLAG